MPALFRILLLGLLLAGCGHHPRHEAIGPGSTVLVLGDSVSYGTGAGKGEDYPTLLAANTGWNVINAGVPGDTTADALERLPDLLEEHAPKLVLVELGGNDFLRHVPQEQTSANLRNILTHIQGKHIPAVLIAVPSPNIFGAALRNLSDAPVYAQISEETGTPVVTDVLAEVLSKNELKSDQIHPNAEGYRLVATGLAEALKDLGYLR